MQGLAMKTRKEDLLNKIAELRDELNDWRAAKAMGYLRAITYTLPSEGGASLRAAGWVYLGRVKGGSWSRPSRKRNDDHPLGDKDKWGIGDVARMTRSAKPDEQFDYAGSGGELRLCEYHLDWREAVNE